MSKYGSLLKKTEAFARLANYGSRQHFLSSLAQGLPQGTITFPDTNLMDMLGRVAGAVSNLAGMITNNPELSYEAGMASQLASALQKFRSQTYMSSKEQLDNEASSLRNSLTAAMNLEAMVNNVQNVSPDARNMAKMMKQEAESAQNAIVSFYRNQGFPTTDYVQKPEEKAVLPKPEQAKPAQKPADAAKRLAGALIAKVDQLPKGPERQVHLSIIESGVRALQNFFRRLQNSKSLQDYFAKIEIVKALQKVYSELDYNDLEVVKSLDNGRGVPESPEATI